MEDNEESVIKSLTDEIRFLGKRDGRLNRGESLLLQYVEKRVIPLFSRNGSDEMQEEFKKLGVDQLVGVVTAFKDIKEHTPTEGLEEELMREIAEKKNEKLARFFLDANYLKGILMNHNIFSFLNYYKLALSLGKQLYLEGLESAEPNEARGNVEKFENWLIFHLKRCENISKLAALSYNTISNWVDYSDLVGLVDELIIESLDIKKREQLDFFLRDLAEAKLNIVEREILKALWLFEEVVYHFTSKMSSVYNEEREYFIARSWVEGEDNLMNFPLLSLKVLRRFFLSNKGFGGRGVSIESDNPSLLKELQLGKNDTFLIHMEKSKIEEFRIKMRKVEKRLSEKLKRWIERTEVFKKQAQSVLPSSKGQRLEKQPI